MKILVVFSAALALAVAKPTVVHYTSPLQNLFVNQDASGGYSFGYSGDLSSKSESRTSDGSTKGSYSYIDANGIVQQVSYEADDAGGFRVAASNLPVAGAAEAAAASASATPYTGPIYKGPKANHQLGVPPPDTPEVAAAKAEHFAAKAAAEAAASGSGSGISGRPTFASAGAAGLATYGSAGGAGLSGLSGLSGVSGYSALGSSGFHGAGYAAVSQGVYQGPKANHRLGVPPDDTPEVSAARAEHLATVAAVASRDQASSQLGAGALAGLGAGLGAGVGAGLGAGAGAGAGAGVGYGTSGLGSADYGASAYSGSGAFGGSGSVGGYQGPKANHVLGQPPMDTPEVTEARKLHLITKAQVEARDQAAGSGAGFGVGSAFGAVAGAGAGYRAGVGQAGFGGSGISGYQTQAYVGQGAYSSSSSSSFRNPDPGVIAPSVPVSDTAEVAAERQRHLALVEQAKIASLNAIDDSAQHDDGSYKGAAGEDDGQYREPAFGGAAQFDDGSYKGEGLAAGAGLAGRGKVITPASTSLTGGYSAAAFASGAGAYSAGTYSGRQGAAGRSSITPASTTLTSTGGASGLFAGSSISGGRGLSYSFTAPAISKTYLPPVSSGYSARY